METSGHPHTTEACVIDHDAARLLTPIPGAMASLGVSRTTVYDLANDGEIVKVHIGRRAFIVTESLAAYVDRLSEKAAVDRLSEKAAAV